MNGDDDEEENTGHNEGEAAADWSPLRAEQAVVDELVAFCHRAAIRREPKRSTG
jgi:hypothetical protein